MKLLVENGELYVLVRSEGRRLKERGIRRRRLKRLWRRLEELQGQRNSRDELMLKLGAARKEAGRAWSLVDVHLPTTDGRHLVLPRHTRPNKEHELLLYQLGMTLPQQPAPRIAA